MAQLFDLDGKLFEFPDDATPEEVNVALKKLTAPPPMSDVLMAIPGEARRNLASMVAGADVALGDVFGSERMRRRGLDVKKQIAEESVVERPPNMGILEEGILQGGASALTQLPAMAATAIGGPAMVLRAGVPVAEAMTSMFGLGTTMMGAQTGFSRYGDQRQAGMLPARAAMHSVIDALIEKYTEYLPLKELANAGGILSTARRYLIKEGLGEQLATLGQDINAKLSDQPDMTLGDYLRDALVTAVATPVAGGAQLAVASAGRALAAPFTSDPASPTSNVPPVPVPAPTAAEPPGAIPPLPATGAPSAVVPPVQPAVAPPNPVEVPEVQTAVRVYLAGETEGTFTATIDEAEVAQMPQPAKYVDLPFDQLKALQDQVPDADRGIYAGSLRFPLPKDPSLAWKEPLPIPPAVPAQSATGDPTYVPGVTEAVPVRAAQEPAPEVVTLNLRTGKATGIVFPDAASKALWKYGAALGRIQTTMKPANSAQLNTLRDAAKEATGVTDDVVIADQAQRYVAGAVVATKMHDKNKKKLTLNAPPVEQALQIQKAHEEKNATEIGTDVKRGEVALRTGVPMDPWIKQMQAYLQAWVGMFSPHSRIVIMGVQSENNTERARTWFYNGTHYVYLPREQNKVLGLYVLSHEFGHMLITEHLNNPKYAAIKDALIEEYTQLISKTEGSASRFVRDFGSPIDILGGNIRPEESAVEFIARAGEHTLTFDEWAADQMVRYMHTNKVQFQIEGERAFWEPLFKQLKDFFERVIRKFAPSVTYTGWVESLSIQDSAAVPYIAPPAPTVRAAEITAKPGADFGRLTTLIGSKLYGNPTDLPAVSIKEMVQNAFDAIKGAQEKGQLAEGIIDIIAEKMSRTISVKDNGEGMPPEVLANQFLQIAGTHKTTKRPTGSLGLAKGLFLYGNEKIYVSTINNGQKSVLETTGKELMAAADGMGPSVKIFVEPTTEPNGTFVKVVVPKEFEDPTTNEIKQIEFPYFEPPVLSRSPLFGNITVKYNNRVMPIGKEFPMKDFGHFATVKFKWGTAEIYVGKDENKSLFGDNVHILGNGLWQFSQRVTQKPLDYWSEAVPRLIYVDITPTVTAEQPGYPFDLNRQQASITTKADFATLTQYLGMVYRKQSVAEEAKGFGTIGYINRHGLVTRQEDLTPPMSKKTAAGLYTVTKDDDVSVIDGKLFVNNREVPLLTKEDIEKSENILSEFQIDQTRIDPTGVMIHDNVNVNEEPLPHVMRREFGLEFDKFLYRIGLVFGDLTQHMQTFPGLQEAAVFGRGISFDKTYHGVNTINPFKGMFVNPAMIRGDTVEEKGANLWLTMVHEIGHVATRNHSTDFISELQGNIAKLLVSKLAMQHIKTLTGILRENEKIYFRLNEVFSGDNAKARGQHLPDVRDPKGSGQRPSDVVGTGSGASGTGALYEAVEKFSADGTSVDDDPGVAKQDPVEVVFGKASTDLSKVPGDTSRDYEYTTRVLNRLPNKQNIKKVTIYGELGRADVRKQEREMIGRILHDIPGESVDKNLFVERVLGEVVPLRLRSTATYAGYGLSSIDRRIAGDVLNELATPETHIWEAQGVDYTSPHFQGDSDAYWAHSRGFVEDEGSHLDGTSWNVVEVQNDLTQHGEEDELGRAEVERQVEHYQELIRELSGLRSAFLQRDSVIVESILYPENLSDEAFNRELRVALGSIVDQLGRQDLTVEEQEQVSRRIEDVIEEEMRPRLQEQLARLNKPLDVPPALPKNWWELILRHEATWAAKEGHRVMRVATADTVAKVEGWATPLYESLGDGTFQDRATGATYTADQVSKSEVERPYGDQQGIYDRYADEITKFVKREFNAKPYTDDKGHSWWEWELDSTLATMPIVYYNTVKAVGETGEEIAKKSQVPDLPTTFVRFQGFLQNTLQLNQIAKLLPEVVGLQRYRTAMRSLHALKAKLFEGPNDRIHEWHKLGRKQAKLVEQALRDEQLGGEHWTALTQTDVDGRQVWVHIPTASFDKFMRERGIAQPGQELFLGIKNDYLSTLTAMEEVVRKHTSEFFEKNPVVLAKRTAEIDEEFAKLRAVPYLPDTRFGRYSVQVRAGHAEVVDGREIKENELVYFEKFENERQRNRRLIELKRTLKGHKVSGSYHSELTSTVQGLPTSMMDAVTEMLNSDPTTALSQEQMAALEQVKFDQSSAGRFAKYLRTPAKHLAGASKDMRRAYAAYHWKTANGIAKLNFFRALTGSVAAVRADAKKITKAEGVSDSYDKLVEYMQSNFAYVMNPQHEFEQLRAFVSLWYLWGSAKTAVMNLTSVPVLTYPYLWARFGNLQAQAALLRAMKDAVQFWKDPTKLTQDRQRVLEKMKADGVTDQSFASMLASVSDGGVAFEKIIPNWGEGEGNDIARRIAWRITSMGMMPFRVVEQFNRQVTGLAAYDLMVAKTGKTLSSGDLEAYNFARDAVDYTQNEYGAWNRPPIMQGKQSILLLFFSFVQNMSFLMFGGDKAWWRAMLVLGALAGLQGLPGMDNLIDMFNWTARKLTGQHVDLRNEAREVAREIGLNPDMVMHGLSHNWLGLGWDTSSSVGAGRIIPGTDAIFGIGKFEDRFLHATSEIGGPVGSLMLSFLQALADDNPSQLLRWDRALPPVLRNIEKAYVAATRDAWINARGRPVADDPTTAELAGQALGFSPTRRTERSEELRAVKDIVQFYKERKANLMEMMWAAKRTHDREEVLAVRTRIAEFNNQVPSPSLKITGEDINGSMVAREKLDRETSAMRSPQKRYRDIYRYIDELY